MRCGSVLKFPAMTQPFHSMVLIAALAGCSASPPRDAGGVPDEPVADTQIRPAARPAAPPDTARTAEQFDTTTEEERAAAVSKARSGPGGRNLGTTIASLGSPSEPGLWLKTPLVATPVKGRVEFPEKGTSVTVDLIPIGGEPGSGSRISLAAMRLIGAELSSLPEVRVFSLPQ